MVKQARSVGLLLVVAALGSMLGGCRFFSFRGVSDPGSSSSSLVVDNGYQEGDMGDVAAYRAETFVSEGSSYTGHTSIRLESQGSGWWVMSLVAIDGPSLDDLTPGVVYSAQSTGVIEDGQPDIDVTGCSGPSQGDWTYDTHATRSELEIEDVGGGLRRVHFRAWFDRGGSQQIATGEFDYRTVR